MSEQALKESSRSIVEAAFTKLNFKPELDQHVYVRKMKTIFGRDGIRFMDAVDSAIEKNAHLDPDVMRRIYRKKNKDWRLSLFVTLHDDVRKFHPLLEWLVSQDLPTDGRLLEIGCDIGALTCLMAKLYPSREIIGIDRVREAILNAKILARKKNVENASFLVFGLGGAGAAPNFSASLGIAPFVFQEVFRNCLSSGVPSDEERRAACQIAEMLSPGGQLISVDRLPGGHEQARPMVDLIQEAGLVREGQDTLEVPGPIMVEKFPISMFRSP